MGSIYCVLLALTRMPSSLRPQMESRVIQHGLIRVMNIAPHVGGGVGSVLRSLFKNANSDRITHSLYCLDRCVTNFSSLENLGEKVDDFVNVIYKKEVCLQSILDKYDIILLHYWNHPLMASFLSSLTAIDKPVLVWTHNSGLHEPHIIPEYLVEFADKIIFTTACSFKANNLIERIKSNPEKFCSVHSTSDLDDFIEIYRRRPYPRVCNRLLYVGTVSDIKMHADSYKIFAELSKLGYRIDVVGGPEQDRLLENVRALGGSIRTHGPVSDVKHFYGDADLFVYPLSEKHYGSGEQVILEAMATGLPIIAFDNSAESEIIVNNLTGYLVGSIEAFIAAVKELSYSPVIYRKMSRSSKLRVDKLFNNRYSVRSLEKVLIEAHTSRSSNRKRVSLFRKGPTLDVLSLYLTHSFFEGSKFREKAQSATEVSKIILQQQIEFNNFNSLKTAFSASTKGSPRQYIRYLGEDKKLLEFIDFFS